MRPLVDASTRWQDTIKHSSSLSDLQRAVKFNGPASPCISGCRSVCWKAFLLGHGRGSNWSHELLEARSTYASLRDHFLKYIKHPEYLANVHTDPLADDADSPWNTLRQDEVLRAEILQDVQRLPDEPFYHEPRTQILILDVLFIYCKLNPDVGGYRQGMHELLAPIVYVVEKDAIDPAEATSKVAADLTMVEMLDVNFIEHDAFALFSRVMDRAKVFYETESRFGQSSIVETSKHIHEVLLYKTDPELSNHLKNIEILPQIFLIRWIRLLLSREFPFDQILVLWDTLFSIDPSLQLIDLVCTAMLLRIRWELLEADYSVALQLLLRYPPPKPPHGPQTFIDDAVYLRDHLNTDGASTLVMKYTGRTPVPLENPSRPSTPRASRPDTRANARSGKLPLSPSRFIQQPGGGLEALFQGAQGAAKGMLERGEKLGVNQAVRDALVEIRRNVSEARSSMKAGRDLFAESGPQSTAMQAVAAMDQRNRQLASMLDETVATLKSLATTEIDDKQKHTQALETAAAKIQFVKVYLEDSTINLPGDEASVKSPSMDANPAGDRGDPALPTEAVAAMAISTPEMTIDSPKPDEPKEPTTTDAFPTMGGVPEHPSETDPGSMMIDPLSSTSPTPANVRPAPSLQRPQGPIPTRSTIAQSSFSWMLEPDQSAASSPPSKTLKPGASKFNSRGPVFQSPSSSSSSAAASSSKANAHRKRPSANATRERTAFLFGEVPSGEEGVLPEDMFGLRELKKGEASAGGESPAQKGSLFGDGA